jgi:hypothetical protein
MKKCGVNIRQFDCSIHSMVYYCLKKRIFIIVVKEFKKKKL